MQILFLPTLRFGSQAIFEKVQHLCQDALEQALFERRQKWLGVFFQNEIEQGVCHQDLLIRWVSQEVGYGVFALEEIPAFAFIGEYTGEVRCRKRADKHNHYCFDYSIGEKSPFLIDAEKQGNLTRFINHSARPNLEPIAVLSQGAMHLILQTKRAIAKGEQLTYDYGEDYWKKRSPPEVIA